MAFHVAEQSQMARIVEEHAPHDFCQNMFGRTGHASVIEQMAGFEFWIGEHRVGHPSRRGVLVEARHGLEQFDTVQHAAILVLPTASSGEHLLEHEGTIADFILVPSESAEIAQGAQYSGGQDAARAEPRPCGNGGEQGDFDAAAKGFQLLTEGGIGLCAKPWKESSQT